jgi:L-alanine-DL-glutamate epimerase-like enolase superfamily enzyme
MAPEITRVESIEFKCWIDDLGWDENGFNFVYDPGNSINRRLYGLKINTDVGITGEYVGGTSPGMAQVNMFADYLVGKNPLHRERHWSEIKRALRKYDRMGIGPVDIALWDFAGKYHDSPIHELLGKYRTRIPAYASTYHGDENGGLDSPEAFADFAEECLGMGCSGFKMHGWSGSDDARDIEREATTVRVLGDRVGDRMDLMCDPACEYETFGDAPSVLV